MSLQLAAQHLASRGRGPDTTLVHMAPREVAGLQALAKAHGGSLTVNPDTGLAEAGFLSSILPLALGAALGPAGFGLTAMQAGLAAGAVGTLATGSLSKGLMAGLGAYGGAGLAGGLMGAGAAGAGTATQAAMSGVAAPTIGTPTAGGLIDAALTPAASSTSSLGASVGEGMSKLSLSGAGPVAAPSAFNNVTTSQLASGTPLVNTATTAPALSSAAPAAKAAMSNKDLWMYGLSGLAPMLIQEPERLPEKEKLKPTNFNFAYNQRANPNAGPTGAQTGERMHFDPRFTRIAAGGGLMDIGPIEAMSDRNQAETMMANGGMRFAEGGETKAVKPVEQDPYYTMSGQSGDAFKYLMGQGQRPAAAPAPVMAPVAAAAPVYEDRPGGEWVDDTSNPIKSYTFDPTTGGFTQVAAPKVWRAFAPAAAAGNYFYGGGGGFDGGFGPTSNSTGIGFGAGFAPANPSDFGASDGVGVGVGASDGSGPGAGAGTGGASAGDSGDGGVGAASAGDGWAKGGLSALARAQGGVSHLGDYSDGGRLLKGPGDGVSDSIPASIGDKRPARLADGEFVVPARIVSELGNGSTEAGARKLYAMMDRVQSARKKSIGKNRVAVNSRAEKLLPA
jgi:hypothetical protein